MRLAFINKTIVCYSLLCCCKILKSTHSYQLSKLNVRKSQFSWWNKNYGILSPLIRWYFYFSCYFSCFFSLFAKMSLTLNRFCNLGFSFSKQAPTSAQWFHFSGLDSAKRSTKTDLEKRAPPKGLSLMLNFYIDLLTFLGYRPPTPYSLFTKEVYKPGMSVSILCIYSILCILSF